MNCKLKFCGVCGVKTRLWAANPPMCKNCAMIAYANKAQNKPFKPLSQTVDNKPAKVFKIAPISKNRAEALKKYRIVRDEYLKGKKCEYPGCLEINNLDLHHSAGRCGKLLTDNRFFKALCRKHHTYVETHPNEAIELKLSVKRLNKVA